MGIITSNKRRKLQPLRLWIFAFLFLTIFCFIFFTGCFCHIDPLILKLFNNIDRADHRVSAHALAPDGDISLLGKNLFSIKQLKSPVKDGTGCSNFTIFNEPQETGNNTSYKKNTVPLPATIKKFQEKYASNDSYNKNPGEDSHQGVQGDSGNIDSNTFKTGDVSSQDSLQTVIDGSFELQLLNLINSVRQTKNLAGLNYNGTLNNIALSRSKDMLNRGYFSHTTPEGKSIFIILQENSVSYSCAGENIYYSHPPSSANPEKAFNVWMGSSGHRANLLAGYYSQIGIGLAANSEKLVITLVFLN
jgi:uncharacterized protein YkwD